MLKIAGIIAEYNPFHNGHAAQIAALHARGYDAVVCVCSPSVVQRGTAALFPAAVRTRAALAGGADVVLSLPAPYATLSAEGFAAAGVRLLSALGVCDTLAFGAETADTALLQRATAVLQSAGFSAALKAQLTSGVSFAAARCAAAQQLSPELGALLQTPNNILGVEYCKALRTLAAEQGAAAALPTPLALLRKGAQHDAPLSCSAAAAPGSIASATALRTLCTAQGIEALAPYVPAACMAVYRRAAAEGQLADSAAFSVAILSRLRSMSPADFAQIRGVNEGLEFRLSAAVQAAATLGGLYDALKTKRYAHARMRRLVLDAALGVTNHLPALPPYLHVLGATETGLAVLKAAKGVHRLPLSQSLAALAAQSEAAHAIALAHSAAEDLAALCLQRPQPQGTAYSTKFILV